MFYRFLGKFFFLFYICPRIAREFRLVRKHFNPMLNQLIQDAVKKAKNDITDVTKNPTGSPTSS